MATITVYPNGDGTKTSWTNEASGTTNIYQSIDEGTSSPNDSDYVQSGTSLHYVYFTFEDMPVDFDTLDSYEIKLRLNRTSSKGDYQHFASCQLFKADESTAITSSAHTITDTTTITTYTFSTTALYDDKTTWDGVRLKVSLASAGGAGNCRVYAAQLDLVYTPTSSGSTYDEVGTGGATAGGLSLIDASYSIGATGGALAGGLALISTSTDAIEGLGGALAGGAADIAVLYSLTTTGGVVLAGAATEEVLRDGEGGVVVGGSAIVQKWFPCNGQQVITTAGLYELVYQAWNAIEDDVFEVKLLAAPLDDITGYADFTEADLTFYEDPIELDKTDFVISINGNIVAIDADLIPQYYSPETPTYIYGYALVGQTTRIVWWVNAFGLREISAESPSYFNVVAYFKREE